MDRIDAEVFRLFTASNYLFFSLKKLQHRVCLRLFISSGEISRLYIRASIFQVSNQH